MAYSQPSTPVQPKKANLDYNVKPARTSRAEYRAAMRGYRHLVAIKPGSPSGAAVVVN